MISQNYQKLCAHIEEICHRLARDFSEVTLVGVTKFADNVAIQEALQEGLGFVAENKVQEAAKKFPVLREKFPSLRCHMIGHLQSNKAREAVVLCDMIESVDSAKLAQEINKHAQKLNKPVDILLQVNTACEEQKFGLAPQEVNECVKIIKGLDHVCLQGLMTIAPLTDDKQVIRNSFCDLKKIFDGLKNDPLIEMKYLSMGMTNDYEIALEEGANMLRIGSAIFK